VGFSVGSQTGNNSCWANNKRANTKTGTFWNCVDQTTEIVLIIDRWFSIRFWLPWTIPRFLGVSNIMVEVDLAYSTV